MEPDRIVFTAAVAVLWAVLQSAPCIAAETPAPGRLPPETAAYERADFKEALRLAVPLAQGGDAQAEHTLGLMYASGQGVPEDFVQAARWYEKAADQGLEASQNNLGTLYVDGKGVPQDYAKAAFWFRKAADQGALQGLFNLGSLYESGHGVPQDYKQAAALYRQVAESFFADWSRHNSPHPDKDRSAGGD